MEILVSSADCNEIQELNKWHFLHQDRSHHVDFSYLLNMTHREFTTIDKMVIMGQKLKSQVKMDYLEKHGKDVIQNDTIHF